MSLNSNSLRKLVSWGKHIHPSLAFLVATVGTIGLSICLIILSLLAWLFSEVLEREAFGFDTSFLLWLHQFANPYLDNLMLAITQLGDPIAAGSIALVSLGLLWWQRYRQEAKIFAIACLGGAILNTGLKLAFGKPRPHLWPQLIAETSFSFPSGHALGSVVLYGLIAYLLVDRYSQFAKSIYIFAAIAITAITFSRLYLGVHWPTDVIAGCGIGFLWLMICITMLRLQKLKPVT
jgi:membrane-associated phospholipid phosphatase